MKKTAMVLALTGALGMTAAAQATLFTRPGGMVYDDVRKITWLADANYANTSGYDADGLMNWNAAITWANNLVYGGYDDWRLPTSDICFDWNCTGSEMGYMFYTNLAGIADTAISASHNANYNLFSHIQDFFYWSGTEEYPGSSFARNFGFGNGLQGDGDKISPIYAWAVRDGDVAAVPEPTTALLFGVGAVVFGLSQRYGWWQH